MAQIAALKTSSASLEAERDKLLEEMANATQKITDLDSKLLAKTEDHTTAIDNHANEAKTLKSTIEEGIRGLVAL